MTEAEQPTNDAREARARITTPPFSAFPSHLSRSFRTATQVPSNKIRRHDLIIEQNCINPEEYIRDILPRLHTHPNSRVDELLPHRWRPQVAPDSS